MQTFKDRSGREWTIIVDYAAVERVYQREHFNLLSLLKEEGARANEENPLLVVHCIYAVIEPQAKPLNVTYEQFRDSLDSDSTQPAVEILLESLVNFSQSRVRPALKKLLQVNKAAQEASLSQALKAAEAIATTQAGHSSDAPALNLPPSQE